MELTPDQILNGIFSLIFVVISILIGLTIISKYPKSKNRTVLFVGFVWLGIVSSWYASSSSFLVALITGGDGYMSTPPYYFIIGAAPLPITAFIWMFAFTELLYRDKKRIILLIFAITGIIFEIALFILLLIDYDLVGTVTSPVDAEYELFVTIYQIFLVILVLISGTLFARESLKSDTPEIKLKGRLLLTAFLSFVIGSILEILSGISIVVLIIARLLLISSSIEFYGGFILPRWMEKLFLRNK
ncbi:MAG: hypothetical protein ACFFG0_22385 [Candidatus Thorarchaeota archaeon]